MSYDSHVYGEITITPPLPFIAFRDSSYRKGSGRDTTLIFREDLSDEEGTPGQNICAAGIVARYDESGRHYRIKEELQEIIGVQEPDHEYTGALIVVDDEPGDIVRYRVEWSQAEHDHVVIEEKAVLAWPDGTEIKF